MADLKQLEEAMLTVLQNMGEKLKESEQAIETLKQKRAANLNDFHRLFQSFLSLVGQQQNTLPSLPQVNVQQTPEQIQAILKTQQAAMQQANPPQVKMPQKPQQAGV